MSLKEFKFRSITDQMYWPSGRLVQVCEESTEPVNQYNLYIELASSGGLHHANQFFKLLMLFCK